MKAFSVNHDCRLDEQPQFEPPVLSIVIPLFNEKDSVRKLYDDLILIMEDIDARYEIIFVNDGSTDGSAKVLEEIAAIDSNVKLIVFRRNYGQTSALAAGFKYAHGEIVISMDADLQNDPKDIPKLVGRIRDGADVVSGWRRNRKDTFFRRRLPSILANWFVNKLISGTGVYLHDYGCTLKAYRREVLQNLKLYGEMHRFIPAYAAWLGVKIVEVEVTHHPRRSGRSKYGLSRILTVLLDFVVVRFFSDYMVRPIQFFGKIAIFSVFLGIFFSILMGVVSLWGRFEFDLNTYLTINFLTFIIAMQFVVLGLLGELQVRAYYESQDKDPYYIREIIQKRPPGQFCCTQKEAGIMNEVR